MYTYSTIPELIKLLDENWQNNETFTLQYKHDKKYDLIEFTLLQNENILHEAYFEIDNVNFQVRFFYQIQESSELRRFLEQFEQYKYKPENPETILTGKPIQLGSHVMISDPCYDTDTWCNGDLKDVLPGTWRTKVIYMYDRCTDLIAWHKDVPEPTFDQYEKTDIVVGVDSGQAGIYDYKHFAKMCKNEKWYESICTHQSSMTMPLSPLEQRCVNDNKDLLPFHEISKSHLEEFFNLRPICKIKYGIDILHFNLCPNNLKIDFIEKLSTDKHSVVSSSGYGDGSYDCYVAKNQNDEIIAIRINYITPEELEDDY